MVHLQDSRNDLLANDFEGCMRIFRVSMPRKYLTETDARLLLRSALLVKVKSNYNILERTPLRVTYYYKDHTDKLPCTLL